MKISVLGAGAWGTALARLLHSEKCPVTIWGHDPNLLAHIRQHLRNDRYLPEIPLPAGLMFESDLSAAIKGADWIVVAVPSKAFRGIVGHLRDYSGGIISVTKGIEYESGLTMCGILAETAPKAVCATLSGPTFAIEVARDIPTAIVAASRDLAAAAEIQKLFSRPSFRVYTSSDMLGVELGGALKNVIAIAAGVGDGLGFGDNAKASLVTRAIVEIRRLGVACGAQFDTFTGLSGLGDLMVTCFSRHSRNRGFGERLGRGEKSGDIVSSMVSVAEGYPTARSAYRLAREHQVSTPIIDETHAMLYEGKNIQKAVRDLMTRDLKAED
jgi:glycerol-3-phosphate dehydrogenase (NAD(P)+)